MFTLPTTLAPDALASVSEIISDTGILNVTIAVIALPVAFWVIRKVVGLFPKEKRESSYITDDELFKKNVAALKQLRGQKSGYFVE